MSPFLSQTSYSSITPLPQGSTMTVTAAVPLTVPLVAVIVVVPRAKAETSTV